MGGHAAGQGRQKPLPAGQPQDAENGHFIRRADPHHLPGSCLLYTSVLTYAERELATVAIIASLGKGVEPMLKGHMGMALKVGVTPDELRGVLAIIEKNIGRSEAWLLYTSRCV